ncbi:hypothetical protein BB558_001676 [Smittium angustum]|uniref:Uncharacterized protein n=1 Tax=Smittium angustum TaxID=133377 RepID=A0A2U1JAZ9_SMIAN|nr:hypothetical protein BB558_001676 [Smittium angustum]
MTSGFFGGTDKEVFKLQQIEPNSAGTSKGSQINESDYLREDIRDSDTPEMEVVPNLLPPKSHGIAIGFRF